MLETLKEMSKPSPADPSTSPLLSGTKPIAYDAVDGTTTATTSTNKADRNAVEAVIGGETDIIDDDATEVATEADAATEVGSTTKLSPKSDKLTIA